jgi:two-component system nitrate/nitrite response regulator NarL
MGKPALSGRVSVCVFSSHPLVFPALEGLLAGQHFDLEDCRFRPDQLPEKRGVAVLSAEVYVVELGLDLALTEALIGTVLSQYPWARVLVVAEEFNETRAFPLLRLGTKGLVTYQEAAHQLGPALEAVATGGYWVPRSLLTGFIELIARSTAQLEPRRGPGEVDLTRREREVLQGVLEHLSNKDIAKRLGVTERTAKFHVSNLLAKYRVRRRADLLLLFLSRSSQPASR